ncbi:calcium-binding protein [Aliishimia ponticola]|nr:calcium-binding protein [Aliishimia ponticola]
MSIKSLSGYSFTVTADGSYEYLGDILRGGDDPLFSGFEISASTGGTQNAFGLPQIALTGIDGGTEAAFLIASSTDERIYAYEVTLPGGDMLEVLEYVRGDGESGEILIIGGDFSALGDGSEGLSALISAMGSAAAIEIGTVFEADDLPVIEAAADYYSDTPAHSSRLVLGGSEANILKLGDGADYVFSGDGDDWISASGNHGAQVGDSLFEIYEVQTIEGGFGNDTIKFIDDGAGTIIGDAGDDRIFGGEYNDILIGGLTTYEGIEYTDNDVIVGNGGDDAIYGGEGDDWMHGGAGNDEIYANMGSNTLRGGDGHDYLNAGAYADADTDVNKLFGGDGNDFFHVDVSRNYLVGGAGDDSFFIFGGAATIWGGTGEDTIFVNDDALDSGIRVKDFTVGEDIINLADALIAAQDFDTLMAGAEQKSWGTKISDGDGALYLLDTTVSDLSASDFVF